MNKPVLILGANGMAGHITKKYLQEKGYDVYYTTREASSDDHCLTLEIKPDMTELEAVIKQVKPAFVVNCIGILNEMAETNHSLAVVINSYLPNFLDGISAKYGFKLIHISTDCVFSGEKGKYSEKDLPDATSFYGRSKALGEVNNDQNLTLRTSIVGPDINERGIGLFNWFMQQEGTIKGYTGAIWSGVTTLELAKAIEKVFENDATGLFHLVNNTDISKYDLLKLFAKYMRKDITIEPFDNYHNDKSIMNHRDDFDFAVPSYEIMVMEMVKWIIAHNQDYAYGNPEEVKGR